MIPAGLGASAESTGTQAGGVGQGHLAMCGRAAPTTSMTATSSHLLTQKYCQQRQLSVEEEGILPTDLMRDGEKIKLFGR